MKNVLKIFIVLLLISGCANNDNVTNSLKKQSAADKSSFESTLKTDIQFNCPIKWSDSFLIENPHCTAKDSFGITIATCFENNVKNGPQCFYSENKNLYQESNWIKGKRNGFDIELFSNGNIKLIRNFNNGKIFGLYKQFYESGSIMFDGYRLDNCKLKNGACYTEDGITIPLKEEHLNNACYNMLCLDAIKQHHTNKP